MEGPKSQEIVVETQFDKEFNKPQEIEVFGSSIEVIDVDLRDKKSPEESQEKGKDDPAIIIAPGWGGGPEMFRDAIKIIAEKGKRVLALRHSSKEYDIPDEQKELLKKYPLEEVRKALALVKMIQEKKIDKVNLIAHSEAGIYSLIAAALIPEKIESMVLVNPAGFIGKDKFPSLAARYTYGAIRDSLKKAVGSMIGKEKGAKKENERMMRGSKEVAEYFFKNPVKALKEAGAISKGDMHKMLVDLRRQGIMVSVIAGVGDSAFPMKRMQEIFKKGELDGFLSVKGGHSEIYTDPERYISAALELFDSMKIKKEFNQGMAL